MGQYQQPNYNMHADQFQMFIAKSMSNVKSALKSDITREITLGKSRNTTSAPLNPGIFSSRRDGHSSDRQSVVNTVAAS